MLFFLTKKRQRVIKARIRALLKKKNDNIKNILKILVSHEKTIKEQKQNISNLDMQIGDYKDGLSEREKLKKELLAMKETILKDFGDLKEHNINLKKQVKESHGFIEKLEKRVENIKNIINYELE